MADLAPTCDRCPHVRAEDAWIKGDSELMLCGHHSRYHAPALRAAGFERYGLAVPYVSAMAPGAVTR